MPEQIASIESGYLVIRLPLQPPTLSATGKTRIVASTRGTQVTAALVDGRPVSIGVNAWIK